MSDQRGTLPERHERWYEDYRPGWTYDLGTIRSSKEEMIAFARVYDPQPMHVDDSYPGGLIASGWHTVCVTMRQIVDNYLSSVAGLPSPGIESISWSAPVRPNDEIRVTAELLNARLSASKPDRGILQTRFRAENDEGTAVMAFEAVNFVLRRP